MISNFIELGRRLSSFGEDDYSKIVVERAIVDNHWFTRDSIIGSIEAICKQMLDVERLSVWMTSYPTLPVVKPRNILVVMAGNIPAVGFFDMLCVLMSGHNLYIKPSGKDSVLIDYLKGLLLSIDSSIPIYIFNNEEIDAVIATGGESANLYFRSNYADKPSLLRGSRSSIAVLSGGESVKHLELLARDIYTHSGLGCRNVSMLFITRGYNLKLPKVVTSVSYRNNYLQQRALALINEESIIDNGVSILSYSLQLPPALSRISLYEYDSLEQVDLWVSQHDEQLQCIVSECLSHPRRVGFGETQSPSLFDYADAVDTMKFLANI